MPTDREETQRIPTGYGTRKRSRLAQLKYVREQRRKSTYITGGIDSAVASGSAASRASGSMAVTSSSQSDQPDVDDDGEVRPPVTDDSCLFVQVASLKNVVKNISCLICQGDLTVVVID